MIEERMLLFGQWWFNLSFGNSDGTQHIRAWRAGEEIRFLVADYNNAGNDTFLTSHSRLDFRPLKRGDQISGTVTLRIL